MFAALLAIASLGQYSDCANGQCGRAAGYAPAAAGYTYHWGPAYRYPPLAAAPAPPPVLGWHQTKAGGWLYGTKSAGWIYPATPPAPTAPKPTAKAGCTCACACPACGTAPPDHTPPAPRARDTRSEVPIRYDAPPAPI